MAESRIMAPRRLIILSALWLALPAISARADLLSAVLTAYDELEKSEVPRIFISPRTNNDVHAKDRLGPKLTYDPSSGDLKAEVPAVVIDTGSFPYAKLYSISSASIGWSLFPFEEMSLKQSAYSWRNGIGSLNEIIADFIFSEIDGKFAWHPIGIIDPMAEPLAWPNQRAVAGVVDFGHVLPSGLTKAEVERLLMPNGTTPAFVDYANHRGIVTLRVPMPLRVIAEPAAGPLIAAAFCFLAIRSRPRR
jgi:hypothetical protein